MIKLTLVMEEREAEALLAVMRNIGGSPDGPRGFTNEILNALEETDVAIRDDDYLRDYKRNCTTFRQAWPDAEPATRVKCERI